MIKTPTKTQIRGGGVGGVGAMKSPVGTRRTSADGTTQSSFTKIDASSGKVFGARDPSALKEAGNLALKKGDLSRAVHMYTMGIDLCIGSDPEARPQNP